MIEAYTIGTKLTITNLVSPVIAQLIEDYTRLEKLSLSVNRSFNAMAGSVGGIDRLARSVQNLNNQLSATVKNAGRAAASMSAMGATQFSGNTGHSSASSMPFYAPAMMAGTGWNYGRGGGATGGSPLYYGNQRLLSSPTYEGEYSRIPNGAGQPPAGTPPRWRPPVLPISGLSPKLGPMTGYAAGLGAYMVGKEAIHKSAAYDQESVKLRLYGMSAENNAEAVKFADNMKIPGVDRIHALKFFTEAQGIFRESGLDGAAALEGAKLAAPYLGKIHSATAALGKEGQEMSTAKGLSMLRFIEMSGGLKSPQRFNEIADMGWKMTQTSGGVVDWEQLRQVLARGGVSTQNLTAEGLAKFEPIIGELKGMTAGFSARTAFNRLNGIIKLPNQSAHFLVDNGIWDASKVDFNKNGGIKSFKGNPFTESSAYNKDMIGWYEKRIMPLYEKKGITDPSEIGRMNAMMFGSTGGGMFSLIHKQIATINKSIEAQNKALKINESLEISITSKQGKLNIVSQKYSDLLVDLGDEIFPEVMTALNLLATAFKMIIAPIRMINEATAFISKIPVLGAAMEMAGHGLFPVKTAGSLIAESGDWFKSKGGAQKSGGGDVYLDAKKVGKVIDHHQGLKANAPFMGIGSFDGSMNLATPAMKQW